MRSRKLISVVISVLLLGALVLLFLDPWSTLRKDGKRIALADPASVDKIILSDVYDSVCLTKEGEEWLLFGEEKVNPVTVENLLFAAERIQISSIVSEEPAMTDDLGKSVTFSKAGKDIRTYRFWTRGAQYLVRPKRSDRSFQVSLAGYPNLNLDKVFSSSPNHYREHLLIDLLPSEISLIELEIANGNAFRFTQDEKGDIACSPVNQKTTLPPGSQNELTTRLLFSYFTAIRYESKTGISLDSLIDQEGHSNRMARLLVVSHRGEEHTLQIFPFREKSGDETHLFKALVFYNNDPGALIVNYIYLDVLLRDLPHYFGE